MYDYNLFNKDINVYYEPKTISEISKLLKTHYFSDKKNKWIPIKEMNYHHLTNAIIKWERQYQENQKRLTSFKDYIPYPIRILKQELLRRDLAATEEEGGSGEK